MSSSNAKQLAADNPFTVPEDFALLKEKDRLAKETVRALLHFPLTLPPAIPPFLPLCAHHLFSLLSTPLAPPLLHLHQNRSINQRPPPLPHPGVPCIFSCTPPRVA